MTKHRGIAEVAASLLCIAIASRAVEPQTRDDPPTFKSRVDVVQVTATVTDRGGRFVSGLQQDDFRLYEGNTPKIITTFAAQRLPISLGIMVDASASMDGGRLIASKRALRLLLSRLTHPEDQFFLYRFSDRTTLLQAWTSNRAAIVQAADTVRAGGGTAIYDGLAAGLKRMAGATNDKRVILVFTDGQDTGSVTQVSDLRRLIPEPNVLVYAICFACGVRGVMPLALIDIASDTGGRLERVVDLNAVEPVASNLADELTHQYVLGYVASNQENRWHAIRVLLDRPEYRVRARRGYFY